MRPSVIMLGLFVFLLAVSLSSATVPFKIVDCNNSTNKLLRLTNPHIDHDPVLIPGNLTGSVDIEILRPIEGHHYDVSLILAKKILFGWVTLPCFSHLNDTVCTEDLCHFLNGINNHQYANNCPEEIAQSSPDFPCACPFKPGTYHLNPTFVTIHRLNTALQILAQGDYQAKVTVVDRRTNEEVACVFAQVSTHTASGSIIGK